jgi:SAM-dependent methyltransferase
MSKTLEETVQLNREQANFYDSIHEAAVEKGRSGYAENRQANWLTRFWADLRTTQQGAVREAGIEQQVRDHHEGWMKKMAGGDFLEVGCFSGSPFTAQLVTHAGHYLGVELSPKAVEALNRKFQDQGLAHKAEAQACDFLTLNEDRKFDLIYAHGVLHHFENPKLLFEKLIRLSKPGAILLFVDPSAINPLYKVIRTAYRPFQSDAAWEWPFTQNTVAELERHFKAESGLGWGQWSLPFSVLTGVPLIGPLAKKIYLAQVRREVSKGWHKSVWNNSMLAGAYRAKPV